MDYKDKALKRLVDFDVDRDCILNLIYQSKSVIELCFAIHDMCYKHYHYGDLAKTIYVDYIQSNNKSFSETMIHLAEIKVLDCSHLPVIIRNKDYFDNLIDLSRDYELTFSSLITMANNYLVREGDNILESPQYMFLRVAIHIWANELDKVKETYEYMSKLYFIHASPTLFNACLRNHQLASCFLVQLEDDTAEGILKTMNECGIISKYGGGIGIGLTGLRSSKSIITSTQNKSKGSKPFITLVNSLVSYIDQGGRRPGSAAIYMEPYHGDIMDFIGIKRARATENIFNALWIPDLFIERVKNDQEFSLFDQPHSNELMNLHSERFDKFYEKLEREEKHVGRIKAQDIFNLILTSQLETGSPYILFKDTINKYSNQSNLGTIKMSNLCTEIVEYTDTSESAVCNLGSLNLSRFIKDNWFDFDLFEKVIRILTRNLDRVIDVTLYPSERTERSNMKHRPIGIGVQGFQDLLFKLDLPYDHEKSRQLNIEIAEAIYYFSLDESINLAKEFGPYNTFEGSPLSRGIFHWMNYPNAKPKYDYDVIKRKLCYGVRNSLRVAYMPGASTATILGCYECFEPLHSNFYIKQILKANCKVINRYLQDYLIRRNLWTEKVISSIKERRGSIKETLLCPEVKMLFRTAFEIDQKTLIDMNADRCPYIDQSQSANIYLLTADKHYLGNLILYAHEMKTKGIYYVRSTPPIEKICYGCS
jgi:ribonucleoside-diphosphate reductase alpha subunit